MKKNKGLIILMSVLLLCSCTSKNNGSSSNHSSIENSVSSEISSLTSSESSVSTSSETTSSLSSSSIESSPSSLSSIESNISSSEESSVSSSETSSESSVSESIEVHNYSEWIVDKTPNEFEKGHRYKTCSICGDVIEEEMDYTLDFPRVKINYKELHPSAPDATAYGAFASWTWDYLTVPIQYEGFKSDNGKKDFNCYAQMKIQGATSIGASYLKKNYTIKLFEERECKNKNKIKLVDSWGKQSKYVLKANWIDVTSARNLVTAQLWSDVVESRATSNIVSQREYLDKMVHNGAVDGYPVMLYFNDQYFGLYTLNIPKDNWLFGMKANPNEGLLFTDGTVKRSDGTLYESTAFKEKINWDNSTMTGSGWEAEYANDESNTQWMADSMNEAIGVVMNTYGKLRDSMTLDEKKALRDEFLTEMPKHLDLDGCIDYMIFLHCIQGFPDNSTKNIIWSTYDGKIWSPNAYDLDTTWGMAWDGQMYVFEDRTLDVGSGGFWLKDWYHANLRGNALFEAILLFCADKVQQRYNELRAENAPLNYSNISSRFSSFINAIPSVLYEKDVELFLSRPSEQVSQVTGQKNSTDLNQILSYASELLSFVDTQYNGECLNYNINYFN